MAAAAQGGPPDLATLRAHFSDLEADLEGETLPPEQRDLIIKYCLSNSNTLKTAKASLKASLGVTKEVIRVMKTAKASLKASLGVTKEVIARDVVPSTAAELTCAVCVRCHDLSAEAVAKACINLVDEGYQQLEALLKAIENRNEWKEFAARIQVPHMVINTLAPEFGPDLPAMNVSMDRQDRLNAELRGWFGDYDNSKWTLSGLPEGASRHELKQFRKEKEYEYQSLKNFLIHDTTVLNAVRVCEEGRLMAQQADDTAYDGHLAYGEAPAVIFFQASDCGENMSIYPRGCEGSDKRRFLVPPQQLGIHTNAFLMYFVKISESRRSDSEDSTMLQLHVLFLPATHAKRAFCDEHFLMVNKHTFQPFHYDRYERQWKGFKRKKGTGDVDGRGVMVNVCVAQDVPINVPFKLFERCCSNRLDLRSLAMEVGGITQPCQGDKRVGCGDWLMGNECPRGDKCNYAHFSWYAFITGKDWDQKHDELKEIWSETIANPASAEEGAAAPAPAAVEATPRGDETQGAWAAVVANNGSTGQAAAPNLPASRPAGDFGAVGANVTKRQAPRLPELWSIHRGTVKAIATNTNGDYGVFVSIDNYDDGLVHISKLRDDDKRIADIAGVVSIGDPVRVVVTEIKDGKKATDGKQVELSMKQVDLTRAELKTNQRWK